MATRRTNNKTTAKKNGVKKPAAKKAAGARERSTSKAVAKTVGAKKNTSTAKRTARKTAKPAVKQEVLAALPPNSSNNHVYVDDMYKDWFLDYASYVILERAVPYVDDGVKPVQRRILHSMFSMEDGRYNKVANIIGQTMQYHPHGDASIGDALVQLGQKNLLIDTQGNWGNIYTGDSAAASRYIEARLSKFALEVLFNKKTTKWVPSYDGRNKEPVTLPVKFPLILALGVEGIAVGLASKILPHNFNELLQASIDVLRKKKVDLLPDFPTGGIADFSGYNEGLRGGKVKVRAVIDKLDKKRLVVKEIPFGTTTSSLIDSILAANDKGKIKIKKVEDNTAEKVEIMIHLHPDVADDPDKAIEALYAFTNCEMSISPNSCIIEDNKPKFLSVNEILKITTQQTVDLLRKELEIEKMELEEQWHLTSLEKIFIENRIYRKIENCETWEMVIKTIDLGLKPFVKKLKRKVTEEDIVRLTEIKIKRISKYNSFKENEKIKGLVEKLKVNAHNLKNLTRYAVAYFKDLMKKYGKGRERRTVIETFDSIVASAVIVNNRKLYANKKEGFIGSGLKKDEYIFDCSDLDNILAFTGEGTFSVTRLADKTYVGKDLQLIELYNKEEKGKCYNIIYRDGARGNTYVKRFSMSGVTRDKLYDLTKGNKGSKVLYFSKNNIGDKLQVTVNLKPKPKLRKKKIDVNFDEYSVKGRSSIGNIISRHPVASVRVIKLEVSESVKNRKKESVPTKKIREIQNDRRKVIQSSQTKVKKKTGKVKSQMKLNL